MSTAATFAAVGFTLLCAHQLADHVLGQTDQQAMHKAKPGWVGWRANLAHVALYHLVLLVMLCTVWWALDLRLSMLGVIVGLGWSAVTHAFLDRRWPVRAILRATGSAPFAETAKGMYVSDQACHYGCLWISGLLMVGLS